MTIEHYRLGCPIWANKAWVGELFAPDAKAADFLAQYAAVFNTVEGNTTFYGMPTVDTVAKWRAATPHDFRFCFKFPRAISHERRLVGAEAETELFLHTLAGLGSRVGPFFLQLPPGFGPDELPALDSFLRALPDNFPYAVEVRHPAFFDAGRAEAALDALLTDCGVDRVLFDARALRAADTRDPDVREAQRKKPDVPVRTTVTGQRPFVRFISDPQVEANLPLLTEWAETFTAWIAEGKVPYIFLHAPDDFYAPRIARHFHHLLAARTPVGTLPPWPAEQDTPPEQLSLF